MVSYGPLPGLRSANEPFLNFEREAIEMKISQRNARVYPEHTLRAATSRGRYLAGVALTIAVYLFCFVPGISAQTPILTQHYDNGRNGQNTSETILTTANVNSVTFGKLFSLSVQGYVYAQPLYVPGVAIAGQGDHPAAGALGVGLDIVGHTEKSEPVFLVEGRGNLINRESTFLADSVFSIHRTGPRPSG